MATRLTNDIRSAIADAVMKHRYESVVRALIAEKAEFGTKVYEDLYSKSTRDKMNALPEGWLPTSDNIAVTFGATFERVYFSGRTSGKIVSVIPQATRTASVPKRLLGKHERGCAMAYEATHKLSVEHANLEAKERDLKVEFDAARKQVDAALSAVTTVKKLIEVWPEIAPFAAGFEDEKPQLPALPTADLNKLFELPVSEAA